MDARHDRESDVSLLDRSVNLIGLRIGSQYRNCRPRHLTVLPVAHAADDAADFPNRPIRGNAARQAARN